MARVLIVDDNLLVRTLLREMLTAGGHEVVGEADSGHAAPVMLRETQPDLVTLDLVMPGRSGLTTLPHLLMLDPNVIVVVVSASLTQGRVIEAIRLGARGFLAKPFDRAQALDAVHEALSGAHGRSPGIDAISEPATHPDEKREFPRVETRLPVVLESGGIRLHTATLNASGGGMLVADVPVRPGDHVDFRIHLNDSQPPVDGSARVVRVDPDAGPALAFERLPAEDYERLISYLYVAGPVPS